MAFAATTNWDVRTTGSDANGGGWDSASSGTDFSQQNAAQVAYTDLVIGSTNTQLTSAGNPFTSVHVGNVINITGGTGFTVQRVQVVSVSAGVATCDKACGTASSTAGTGNLGGALLSPGLTAALAIAGNKVHIKSGTYSITTATVNVAGGPLQCNTSGTIGAKMAWVGYNTTHEDGCPGGTRPILQANASASTTYIIDDEANEHGFDNLIIDGNSLMRGLQLNGQSGYAIRCQVKNVSSGSGFNITSQNFAFYCEALSNPSHGFTNGSILYGCVAHGNGGAGFSIVGAPSTQTRCIAYLNTGAGFSITNAMAILAECDSSGNGGAGFDIPATLFIATFDNCAAYNNTGTDYNTAGVVTNVLLRNCAGHAPGTGFSTTNLKNTSPGKQVEGYITLTGSPWTNAASGDFSLNTTAGAGASLRAAGTLGLFPGGLTTGYGDIGAVQHPNPGASGGGGAVVGSSIVQPLRKGH